MERNTGRSSARQPTPTRPESFALSGPSDLPDPARHAYRRDLADAALAGRVIASHYAEPAMLRVTRSATLHREPDAQSDSIVQLEEGTAFGLLDERSGWSWGYAGDAGLVGYVRSDCLG